MGDGCSLDRALTLPYKPTMSRQTVRIPLYPSQALTVGRVSSLSLRCPQALFLYTALPVANQNQPSEARTKVSLIIREMDR